MRLPRIGMAIVIACAAGALASTLYTGRHNRSWLLIGLFAIWVLSPFLAMAFYLMRRSAAIALFVAAGSLAVYGYAVMGRRAHGAFLYLIVPAASWAALGTAYLASRPRA